jgi:hypothetical protein
MFENDDVEKDSVEKGLAEKNSLEKKNVGKNWLRVASGIALMITAISVVVQSTFRNGLANELYYGTTLMAVFGYLFLTSRTKEEQRDSPWWW